MSDCTDHSERKPVRGDYASKTAALEAQIELLDVIPEKNPYLLKPTANRGSNTVEKKPRIFFAILFFDARDTHACTATSSVGSAIVGAEPEDVK